MGFNTHNVIINKTQHAVGYSFYINILWQVFISFIVFSLVRQSITIGVFQ